MAKKALVKREDAKSNPPEDQPVKDLADAQADEAAREESEKDDVVPKAAVEHAGAHHRPLGKCPQCKQFMLRPQHGDDYCPACNPPVPKVDMVPIPGKRPVRIENQEKLAELTRPKVIESKTAGPFTAYHGFNMFLPKETSLGTWAVRSRELMVGGSWHKGAVLPRDTQVLVRTGIAYDAAFNTPYIVRGLTTLDLGGEPSFVSTKHEAYFNSNVIDVDGELCLAFHLHGDRAHIKPGDFIAELLPVAINKA